METIVERPAALDVHKAQVTACVRVPGPDGERVQEIAEFQTTVRGLLTLRDWLAQYRVTQVAMEATGVFWKPVWYVLEDDFECLLVNARHVKQVPGRKTDVSDAEWLCRLLEAGLLRASFVPPKPIRQLRNLTRYRKTQIQERQREANRLHKALEDAGIKLDCVASDILGKSGRHMLDALVAGTTDPEVLADLARRQMRRKIPLLREALQGHFDAHHRLWIGSILRHIDFLDEQIEQLSVAIEEQIRPFWPAVELICTMTGFRQRGAECVIAEIGADMSLFATDRHLASWAGQCSGNDESAGKRRSGKTRNGSKWLDYALEEGALAAIRVKDGYLAAQYRRLKPRRGHKKALGAVKHTMICAIWHMLSTGETYRDLGGDYFNSRDPERQTRRLVKQLERLGHHVTLQEAAAA
jgi:transposase